MGYSRRTGGRWHGRRRKPDADEGAAFTLLAAFFAALGFLLLWLGRGLLFLIRSVFGDTRPKRPHSGPPPQSPPPHPAVAAHPRRQTVPLPPLRSGARHLLRPPDPNEPLPYRRARRLMSKGEWAFHVPLYLAVKGRYRIFCKLRLADVVHAPPGRRDERRWFRKIGSYHVDFVLADPDTTAPLLVIELDDQTHKSDSRRELDGFKDRVIQSAGLKVLRVPCQPAYDPQALRETVEVLIAASPL